MDANLLFELIVEIVKPVLAVLVPFAAYFVVDLLRRKAHEAGIDIARAKTWRKNELARYAVLFAQQAYKSAGGQEKYLQASVWLAERLAQANINITDEEIRGLIESALKELKLEFGAAWDEAVAKESDK